MLKYNNQSKNKKSRIVECMTEQSPKSGTELVPLDYDRAAFNTIHNTQLEAHNDALTVRQSELINRHYQIDIYVGTHGAFDVETGKQDTLDSEYDAAAAVVEGMKEGDTLFLEGTNFYEPFESPLPQEPKDDFGRGVMETMSALGGVDYMSKIRDVRQAHLDWLNEQRRLRQIDPWSYAGHLALRKGISVVRADYDAFETQKAKGVGYNDPTKNSYAGEDGVHVNGRFYGDRENKSRNVMKDYALEHMSWQAPAPDDKPRLVMLYGRAHKEGLKRAYDELRLEATIHDLPNDPERELAFTALLGKGMMRSVMAGAEKTGGKNSLAKLKSGRGRRLSEKLRSSQSPEQPKKED